MTTTHLHVRKETRFPPTVYLLMAFVAGNGSLLAAERWKPLTVTRRAGGALSAVSVSPDGKVFVTAGDTVTLRNVRSGKVLETVSLPKSDGFVSVAFAPNGKSFAFSDFHGTVRIWDIKRRSIIRTLKGHSSRVFSVAFSPDGTLLASGAGEKGPGELKVWYLTKQGKVQTLAGHDVTVNCIHFSPNGKLLVSAGLKKLIVWELSSMKRFLTISLMNREMRRDKTTFWSVVFSPDSHTIAAANLERIGLWSTKTGKLVRLLKGHTGNVSSIAFSPDGKCLASGSDDGSVKLWEVGTGAMLKSSRSRKEMIVNSVAFERNRKMLISVGGKPFGAEMEEIMMWNTAIRNPKSNKP